VRAQVEARGGARGRHGQHTETAYSSRGSMVPPLSTRRRGSAGARGGTVEQELEVVEGAEQR